MTQSVTTLVQKVRAVLDENVSAAQSGLLDTGTLSIDDMIIQHLPEAAHVALVDAPRWMLVGCAETFTPSQSQISRDVNGVVTVELPTEFLSLFNFKMSDWDYAVTEAILESDPRYAIQHSPVAGLRGSKQRPVVALIQDGSNKKLEAYTSGADTTVTCLILKEPSITGTGSGQQLNYVDSRLVPAIVYYTAYMVAQSVGEDNKNLLAQYYKLLGVKNTKQE